MPSAEKGADARQPGGSPLPHRPKTFYAVGVHHAQNFSLGIFGVPCRELPGQRQAIRKHPPVVTIFSRESHDEIKQCLIGNFMSCGCQQGTFIDHQKGLCPGCFQPGGFKLRPGLGKVDKAQQIGGFQRSHIPCVQFKSGGGCCRLPELECPLKRPSQTEPLGKQSVF